MSEVNESERKRLQSLKEKKEAFRAKEQAVQNALKNLDTQPSKKRIIFDDDIDEPVHIKGKTKKQKNLFDNDEEDDGDDVTLGDFSIAKHSTEGTVTLGNDDRFKLDKRFLEEDQASNDNNAVESNEETDLQKEKEWQLDLLGDVLGTPIIARNKDQNTKKKQMIRYDPSENHHKEYEITVEKTESPIKKVKKKKKDQPVEDVVDNTTVEVSKDIYFSVSDSLTKSLNKEEGQFSLLKSLGRDDEKNDDEKSTNNHVANVANETNQKFQFHFKSRNPFKYDSSDNENEEEESNETTEKSAEVREEHNVKDIFRGKERFFFDEDDVRFNEAKEFFAKESTTYNEFKHLRRELKQIVRSKIRHNEKKSQTWGKKKKIRK